jgi:hypothetical protein
LRLTAALLVVSLQLLDLPLMVMTGLDMQLLDTVQLVGTVDTVQGMDNGCLDVSLVLGTHHQQGLEWGSGLALGASVLPLQRAFQAHCYLGLLVAGCTG